LVQKDRNTPSNIICADIIYLGTAPLFHFCEYGSVFLIAFVLHAFAAFTFWSYFGNGKFLTRFRWPLIKTVGGLLFLGILVIAPRYNELPENHYLPNFVGWQGFAVLITVSSIPSIRFLNALRRVSKKQNVFPRLFERRVNFVRLLSMLSLGACLVICILLDSLRNSSPNHMRAELAFFAYSICIIVCMLVELADWTHLMRLIKNMVSSVLGLLLLIRVFTSCLIAMIVILPSIHEGIRLQFACSSALPFFLAAAGGFALNDYFDAPKDVINKGYRAIPSGRVHPNTAWAIGSVLIVAAALASVLKANTTTELALYSLSIVGVGFYNLLVKHLALSKTFVTAIVSTLPVLYVVMMYKYSPIYFLVPLATAIFLLGREWLMDTRDVKGDAAAGIRTIPIVIGSTRTARLGLLMLITGLWLFVSFRACDRNFAKSLAVRRYFPNNICSTDLVDACWRKVSEDCRH
jgi:geranylgeranylglycerol-phosphate geranylgeranyltransferase